MPITAVLLRRDHHAPPPRFARCGGFVLSVLAVVATAARAAAPNVLRASDAALYDGLADSVAVSGDCAVLGAPNDSTASAVNVGSAYLFRRNDSGWAQAQKLVASDGAAYDKFGSAVATNGNVIVIGASHDRDRGTNSGSVYVFHRDDNDTPSDPSDDRWVQRQKLVLPDGAESDYFGTAVAVSDTTIVVGASEGDASFSYGNGTAYVFRFDGTSWVEEARLRAADGALGDRFGSAVALDGDAALVGAYLDRDSVYGTGSAYVFERVGSTWTQTHKLHPSGIAPYTQFGASVALYGDLAVVGDAFDDDRGDNFGSATVFRFNGSTWVREVELYGSDATTNERFGAAVAAGNDEVIVGAYNEGSGGPMNMDGFGAAYQFRKTDAGWTEERKLVAPTGARLDLFGQAVAASGGIVLVGAPGYSQEVYRGGAGFAYSSGCVVNTDCDDSNPCTTDSCVGGVCNYADNTGFCNDGDACTTGDRCSGGSCSGTPIDCDDGVSCTVDSCVSGACRYDDSNCECTANADCNDSNPCTTDTCVSGACSNAFNTNFCNDGNACTIGDRCSGGACSGTPIECDDGVSCTVDFCASGTCWYDDTGCECTANTDCDDGNPCTTDTCASGACSYVNNTNLCNDGDACTTGDRCLGGICSGTALTCDDGVPCTIDACLNGACVHDERGCECDVDRDCDDGDGCTSDRCVLNACVHEPAPDCCGNGTCERGEDACNCAFDCPMSCGNGVCEIGNAENCLTCPDDCNGEQSGPPDQRFCCGDGQGRNPVDCVDSRCTSGGVTCAPACCGDGYCDLGEDACGCSADCGRPDSSEIPGVFCSDLLDNDCDGLIDCMDPDCATDRDCSSRRLRHVEPSQP